VALLPLRLDRVFWHKLLVAPTTHGGVQFIRYGLVAGIAFIVDFGLLYVFTSRLHWFYLLSATSSFALSVIVNYLLSTAWVFAKRNQRQRAIEITMFIAICTVALGFNDLFMWLFTSFSGALARGVCCFIPSCLRSACSRATATKTNSFYLSLNIW
jgi:putative flippase GtrA